MPRIFKPILFISLCVLFVLTLAGCSSKTGSTLMPEILPKITPTSVATESPIPTSTIIPTDIVIVQQTPIIIEQPTTTVPTELVESFLDQKFPPALLNIYHPGSGSKISSPININAYAYPGDQGKVTVQLFGEDGRLMADQLIKLNTPESGWVAFSTRIPFEINSGGESALLALTTFDGYGRRTEVNSVSLILLQVGDSEIEGVGFQKEPFEVRNLSANQTISGGTLHIEGYLHPYNSSPIIIELIKPNGAIVASKQMSHKMLPSGEEFVAFSTDLKYSVIEKTPVRLTLRQMMNHSSYLDLALSSVLINLKP